MLRKASLALILTTALIASAQKPAPAPPDRITSIESLIRGQQYDKALQTVRGALKQSPGDARLYTLEGIVLSLQNHPTEAIAAFDHALKRDPENPAALRGEAQLLYAAHDQRAIPLLERILKHASQDATAQEMLANLQKEQGDCPAAIEHFKTSYESVKTHPASLEAYASCLFATSRFEQAVPVLQQLVALLPDQTYPKYDLAVVLVRAKQYQPALQVLAPLLPQDPTAGKDPELLSLASEAYERAGDTPKAVALLRQAIVLDPNNPAYFTAFADLCLTHESYEVGITMLNIGIDHLPNEASLYLDRGLMYAQLEKLDEAKADFRKAEQLDTTQSLSAYATDLAELEGNHPDVALSHIRAQVKMYPDSPLLHYILAKLLDTEDADAGGNRDLAEALQSAQEAVRLKPDMVDAHSLLGSIYIRSGQPDKAIEECRTALKYSPNDQGATYHLLVALRRDGAEKHKDEIAALSTRLAELHRLGLKQDTDRKRFRLVEQQAASAPTN